MELNGKKRLTEPAKKEKESFLFFFNRRWGERGRSCVGFVLITILSIGIMSFLQLALAPGTSTFCHGKKREKRQERGLPFFSFFSFFISRAFLSLCACVF